LNIRDRVVDIIKRTFYAGKEYNLNNSQSFLKSGAISSIGMMKLVTIIEEIFSIRIEDDEFLPENLDSVDAISGYLERKGLSN
jgi:acyl carrier protein